MGTGGPQYLNDGNAFGDFYSPRGHCVKDLPKELSLNRADGSPIVTHFETIVSRNFQLAVKNEALALTGNPLHYSSRNCVYIKWIVR